MVMSNNCDMINAGFSVSGNVASNYISYDAILTRSGIYVDDNHHICINNLCITGVGNGTGIIRSNYTNVSTDTYTYVRLPLRFECCANDSYRSIITSQEEERRTIITETEAEIREESVIERQLSEAIAHHEENLARNREASIRERQLISDRREKEKQERQLASEQARNLLLEFLDEENKQRLFDKRNLEILSKLFPDITYIVSTSEKNEMVKAINKQRGDIEVDRLCLIVSEIDEDGEYNWLPIEDVILSIVLYLLNAEEDFLRIAHHHSRSNNHENLCARLDIL